MAKLYCFLGSAIVNPNRQTAFMFRVIFAAIAVALTALWLFVWRTPFGAKDQWLVAPNDAAWPAGAWLLPLGVVVIFGGAAALSIYDRFKRAKSRKEQTNSTVIALVCLAVVGLIWPWSLLGAGADSKSLQCADVGRPFEHHCCDVERPGDRVFRCRLQL